jgi:AbrB family looped-hinge helix DNA binding protein
MTHRVGTKGQVVIPKEIREQLGLFPGTEVDFAVVDGAVTLRRQLDPRSFGGRYPGSPLAQGLLEDRAREPR